ncbi:winged helix-turn-helix transcriptional regulator [Nonomuraea sp. SMC257]|uniref:Winged helix-turn-helix transcriptional regulator n=1 Tax=Nonomuraea montanisoli TaxID=2741721 RepID=A0A7Y6ICX8_9ACTN|nr:ArsR family transcriptional regulator [Nonomuraea montanisoli]NUW35902.1 winged helix-turn-helix transcriptional regulator [Nonomuraea montanisoli]
MEHYTNVRPSSNTSASSRSRSLTHTSPAEVSLQAALDALGDPVRRRIVRELAEVPDWSRPCGTFTHLPVAKSTLSHHFSVLRNVGLLEQRDEGARRLNRLRRDEFEGRFPGLLSLVLDEEPAETAGEEEDG